MGFAANLTAIDRCLTVAALDSELEICRQALSDERIDWVALLSLANQHYVAPALWTAFDQLETIDDLPEDVRNYLSLLHGRNAARNARIRQQCLEIGSTLTKHGVRAALLKGAAWLFDNSVAPASDRMMRDIDLLVHPEQIHTAASALIAAGYRDMGEGLTEPSHFHLPPLMPERGVASVEIHRHLGYRPHFVPSAEVIASASEIVPGLLLPTLHHRISHNVIHAQIENGDFVGGVVNLRDTLDLARLVVRCGLAFDWQSLADEARDRGFFYQLSGAVSAAHEALRSPLPVPLQSFPGRLHAWRSTHQRRWPLLGKVPEAFGLLTRALAWDRDAYPLQLETKWSFRAQLLVNRRRAQRAKSLISNLAWERKAVGTAPKAMTERASARRARRALERQLTYQRAKAQKIAGHEEEYIAVMRRRSADVRATLEEMYVVPPDARVLEVGSGAHGLIFYFETTRGTGVDPLAHYYTELFPAWQRRVQTVAACGEQLPFADQTFDVILCDNVVDHAEFPARTLSEMARVLAPSGLLYFTVNIHHAVYFVAGRLHSAWNAAGLHVEIGPFADHTVHLTLDGARRLFEGLPLCILREHAYIAEAKALARSCPPRHVGDRLKTILFKNAVYEVIAVRG